jgi:hypothetical protein
VKKKKREPKAGPTGPVSGLPEAISEASGAPPTNLADLLDAHRKNKGEDKSVQQALMDAFSYLAYRKYTAAVEKGRRNTDDLLGELFFDLGKCIKRLAKNDIPSDEVEAYIQRELFHSHRHLTKKDTISLAPQPSTIADRKKKDKEPLPKPVRVRSIRATHSELDPDLPANPLEDPGCSHLVEGENNKIYAPSRFNQQPVGKDIDDKENYQFLVDVLKNAAKTPREHEVVELLLSNESGNAIAEALELPRNQITDILKSLRGRVWQRLKGNADEQPVLAKVVDWMDRLNDMPVPRSALAPKGFEGARQVAWPVCSNSA